MKVIKFISMRVLHNTSLDIKFNSAANRSLQNDHTVESTPLKNSFNQQKLNIMTFMKVAFLARLYSIRLHSLHKSVN